MELHPARRANLEPRLQRVEDRGLTNGLPDFVAGTGKHHRPQARATRQSQFGVLRPTLSTNLDLVEGRAVFGRDGYHRAVRDVRLAACESDADRQTTARQHIRPQRPIGRRHLNLHRGIAGVGDARRQNASSSNAEPGLPARAHGAGDPVAGRMAVADLQDMDGAVARAGLRRLQSLEQPLQGRLAAQAVRADRRHARRRRCDRPIGDRARSGLHVRLPRQDQYRRPHGPQAHDQPVGGVSSRG